MVRAISAKTCVGAPRIEHAPPGSIRDAIVSALRPRRDGLTVAEIERFVRARLPNAASSSIRSYLNNNCPTVFERISRGSYRLAGSDVTSEPAEWPITRIGSSELHNYDSLDWLRARPENSIHAVVTDPPYGLVEYRGDQVAKLRSGRGGVWRIPPTFDGSQRSPLPRFTTLTERDIASMRLFFTELATLLERVVVPGANILVATNPLVTHVVANAMIEGGLEIRGQITRLVMTMRGGDRPKGAHDEFPDISVMPRSQHEPWLIFRKRPIGTIAENLRTWGTGGFRRISDEQPFGDVIQSSPTRAKERQLAPHPSLKPQALMRQLVRAVLPTSSGVILDPFAGSGSTLAACNALGYKGIGVEIDPTYYHLALDAIPKLQNLRIKPD